MPLPERVVVDTSVFYALISAGDDFHDRAQKTYARLLDWGPELWTTSYVLVELSNLVHRRLGFEKLKVLVDSLQGVVRIFWIEPNIHSAAWEQLTIKRNTGLSFVDWCTVVSANRLKAHVFTFDKDFEQQGLPTIPT